MTAVLLAILAGLSITCTLLIVRALKRRRVQRSVSVERKQLAETVPPESRAVSIDDLVLAPTDGPPGRRAKSLHGSETHETDIQLLPEDAATRNQPQSLQTTASVEISIELPGSSESRVAEKNVSEHAIAGPGAIASAQSIAEQDPGSSEPVLSPPSRVEVYEPEPDMQKTEETAYYSEASESTETSARASGTAARRLPAEAQPARQYQPTQPDERRSHVKPAIDIGLPNAERALPIHVRVTFQQGGFCKVSLLAHREAELPNDIQAIGNGSPGLLSALNQDWYQDVELVSGECLRTGIVWLSAGPEARWSLSGREIFVLAVRDDLSGYVSAARLVIGEEHLGKLCTGDRG